MVFIYLTDADAHDFPVDRAYAHGYPCLRHECVNDYGYACVRGCERYRREYAHGYGYADVREYVVIGWCPWQ